MVVEFRGRGLRPPQKSRRKGPGGLLLHPREHVRVDRERKGRGAVTKALLDYLGVHARPEQVGDVGMPQVVETDPG